MSLSIEHEEIIDDVRDAYNRWAWVEGHGTQNTWMAIEHFVAKAVQPNLPDDRRGDAYIGLDDGYPCIVIEVGKMRDGKWKSITYSQDGKPMRVLRVGFDRVPYLLHGRKTNREISFFAFVEKWLEDVIASQDDSGEEDQKEQTYYFIDYILLNLLFLKYSSKFFNLKYQENTDQEIQFVFFCPNPSML